MMHLPVNRAGLIQQGPNGFNDGHPTY
jgi:hypothetical protein